MNQPQRPNLQGGSAGGGHSTLGFLIRLVLTVLFIGGVGYGALFFLPAYVARNAPPGQAQPGTVSDAGIRVPPPDSKSVEFATTASIQRQQLSVAKFSQRQLVSLFGEVIRAFDEWDKELLAWEKEGPALLTSEDGKRIAADPEQVRRYRGLRRLDRPGSGELATARKSAEELIGPIREALNNPEDASTPADAIGTGLRNLLSTARNARDSYRQATDAVRSMLAKVSGNAPGAKSLEEAIAALDQEDAAERLAVIDAAEKKAKDEGARRVAEEKAKLARETAEAEAARIRDQTAKKKQEADLAAAQNVEEMAKLQRESEQKLAKLRDEAELRRQGDLKTGSVWKGSYTVVGSRFNATMRVTSRQKDEITASVRFAVPGEQGSMELAGKVKDNVLTLTQTNGSPGTFRLSYQPAARSITGADTSLSGAPQRVFSLVLADDE